ncbi:MAG: endonuclease/exonuclease/phosphatase family protein [Bdellovibrionaceae bacterium]|nr:endonuclease/exonuclease/phosphatase family protein [Pseudobdellovibrionaceae bacterium]
MIEVKQTLFILLILIVQPGLAFAGVKQNSSTFKTLTLNIHCAQNNWKFRLTHILDEVVRISPDVIAFQEVCEEDSKRETQALFIQSYLVKKGYPFKAMSEQFTHFAWANKFKEYVLLISKHKVESIEKDYLPASPLQRGYVAFLINDVWYINTHLEYKSENAKFRQEQIYFLMNRFQQFPHVIMGDFNSSPKSAEQNQLIQNGYKNYFPGNTHTGAEDGNESARIDGYWFSKLLLPDINFLGGEILLKEKVNGQYLSDHFAVLAIFQFKK